ncbi:MAG: hypothetical protein K0Q87_864 [Neobacillus sp.]|nr:hypothetical protein [Neobacillus sp.]
MCFFLAVKLSIGSKGTRNLKYKKPTTISCSGLISSFMRMSFLVKMEEEEGFEPPRGMTRLSVFKTDPFSQTWVFLRIDKK